MSYILEALRKADADRERGRVPDIGSLPPPVPPMVGPGAQVRSAAHRSGLSLALVVFVVSVVGGAAGWWIKEAFFQATPVKPAAAAASVAPGASLAPVPSAPPASAVASPPVPVPVLAVPSSVAPTMPKPVVASAPARSSQPSPVLPADTQKALSALQISGTMHSAQRSARMLIVNGQVIREGDVLTPGVKVLEIRPRDVVVDSQGQAYVWPLPTP